MASRRVECDQVVLAWSSANLLGGSGLGPVAASERWTLSSRDATAGLSDAARYLTDGANQALADWQNDGTLEEVLKRWIPYSK